MSACSTPQTALPPKPIIVEIPKYVPRPAQCLLPLRLVLNPNASAQDVLLAQSALLTRYREMQAACSLPGP